ncbi:MAG TPA: hypothetical protein VM847_00960 [Tahibacter sp.]|jgi:hypothetical protein|nr:hypothetical protein [Tahibacter sp.]
MRLLVSVLLLLVGLIHLLPLPGLLGSERLAALYGLDFGDPNLALLMRHRAVLFGLLGSGCVIAAFRPSWQGVMLAAAAISAGSFLLLALAGGGYNAAIARVVTVDAIAVGAIVIAAVLRQLDLRRR